MIYQVITSRDKANIQILQISQEINSLEPTSEEELIFDLSQYEETTPFSNLVLINAIRRFQKVHCNTQILCRRKADDGYLQHIGFYKTIGFPIGKDPGEAKANPNYVPITPLQFDHLFYQKIEGMTDELAATIKFDVELQQSLSYYFQETIRNAYEHAKTDFVLVAAQNWPSMHLVEIAIADTGCGVAETLRKKFAKDELGLVRYALMPGITAGSNFQFLTPGDPWRNTGYGLYITRECTLKCGGSFILCSGGYALEYLLDEAGKMKELVHETDYQGTALCIRLRTDLKKDFRSILEKAKINGELLAARTEGAIRSASKSSSGRYRLKL